MLEFACTEMTLNAAREPSVQINNRALVAADPDLLIISPCGLNLNETRCEATKLLTQERWFRNLQAVRNNRVVIVDGNQFFNRPGPRIVEAFRWLVHLTLHYSDYLLRDLSSSPDNPVANSNLISTLTTHSGDTNADISSIAFATINPPGFSAELLDCSETALAAIQNLLPLNESLDKFPLQKRKETNATTLAPSLPLAQASTSTPTTSSIPTVNLSPDIEMCHRNACENQEKFYIDPSSGLLVMTEFSLKHRGSCCGNR